MTLDDIRARRWGFAIYAIDPNEPVTLEVFADGETFSWEGASVAEVMAKAFPGKPVVSRDPVVAGSQPAQLLSPPESAPDVHRGEHARVAGSPETTGGVFD